MTLYELLIKATDTTVIDIMEDDVVVVDGETLKYAQIPFGLLTNEVKSFGTALNNGDDGWTKSKLSIFV